MSLQCLAREQMRPKRVKLRPTGGQVLWNDRGGFRGKESCPVTKEQVTGQRSDRSRPRKPAKSYGPHQHYR